MKAFFSKLDFIVSFFDLVFYLNYLRKADGIWYEKFTSILWLIWIFPPFRENVKYEGILEKPSFDLKYY